MTARHALAALLLLLSLPLGCRGVLGIERNDTRDCPSYCANIQSTCTGKEEQWADEAVCLAYCRKIEPGELSARTGNSLACRMNALVDDLTSEGIDCLAAGPGGAGTCGSNCVSYCVGLADLCGPLFGTRFNNDTNACLDECAQFVDCGDYRADPNRNDNTLQCRLFHLSSAALNAGVHCPHAVGQGMCQDPPPPAGCHPAGP